MDLFDLLVKIIMDDSEFSKGIDGARSKADGFGKNFSKGMKTAGKAAVAAIGAASTAIGYLVTNSVKAYAEYEQLVGGVEKLFGKDVSQNVIEYANQAYKTMGLSANQYMEQVTSFSAALINSMGGDTAAAADRANLAMKAIADNVSVFGSDVASVQNAFQGFAKQNYTMLDNLKLGYGGTKTEMERLIKDASQLTAEQEKLGVTVDATSMSFDNQVAAIAVMQEHMGIGGNAAEEAMKTISGSVNATKAAWSNLLLGLADDTQNFGQLIDNFVEVATAAFNNLSPRIATALGGVVQLIEQAFPVALGAITEYLPGLVTTAGDAIISIVGALADALPDVAQAAVDIATTLATTLATALPELIPQVTQGLTDALLLLTDPANMTALVDGAVNIITALAQGLAEAAPILAEAAPIILTNLIIALSESAPQLVAAAALIIEALAQGLIAAGAALLSAVSQLVEQYIVQPLREGISNIGRAISGWFSGAIQGIKNAWSGIVSFFTGIVAGIIGAFAGIVSAIVGFFSNAAGSARNAWSGIVGFFSGIVAGIIGAVSGIVGAIGGFFRAAATAATSAFSSIVGRVRSVANSVVSAFASLPGRFRSIGAHIVQNLISGLLSGLGRLRSAAAQLAGALSIFKHSVPTSGPFAHDDKWMLHFVENLVTGLQAGQPLLENAVEDTANHIVDVFNTMPSKGFNWGQETILGFVAGISLSEQAKSRVRQVGKEISDALTSQISYLNQRISDMEALQDKEAYEKELKDYQKNLAEKKKKLAEAEEKDKQSIQDEITKLEEDWHEKEIDRERKATKERLQIRIDALEDLKDAYDDAMEKIAQSEEKMSSKLKEYGKLFETVHDELRDEDVFGLIDLQGQIDAINHYGDALEQLRERGVTDSLMDEIVSLGVEDATKYADKLLWLSDEYFDQYIQKWEEKQKAAERIAETFYAPEKSDVNNEYLDQFNKLLTETDRQYIDLKMETARTASASAELKSAIDAESTSYVKLQKELQSTIMLQKELNSLKSESVSFSDSALAKTSAAQINANTNASKAINVNVSGNIVSPDGRTLSSYILKDLREVSKANGTPITSKA